MSEVRIRKNANLICEGGGLLKPESDFDLGFMVVTG
jgi:hypothetical protein